MSAAARKWNLPRSVSGVIGVSVITDSPEDPIPEINKTFDVETLVRNERHTGLRSLRISK